MPGTVTRWVDYIHDLVVNRLQTTTVECTGGVCVVVCVVVCQRPDHRRRLERRKSWRHKTVRLSRSRKSALTYGCFDVIKVSGASHGAMLREGSFYFIKLTSHRNAVMTWWLSDGESHGLIKLTDRAGPRTARCERDVVTSQNRLTLQVTGERAPRDGCHDVIKLCVGEIITS